MSAAPASSRAEALREAAARLAEAGAPDPARDARLLMRWATGLEAAALSARLDAALSEAERARFERGVAARAGRVPLSHVLGRRAFWGRDFEVTPAVLDPRPETEILVAWALERGPAARILDLGSGSGCILLTLLAEWPEAAGLGVDASPAALAVAARNAVALGLTPRARFALGDWCAGLGGGFDLIVSNPPYLAAHEMTGLSPEVRAEPAAALDGGADGLDAYRAIAAGAPALLRPGGALLLEIGPTQAEPVSALMRVAGLAEIDRRRDFDHRVRCLGYTPENSPPRE